MDGASAPAPALAQYPGHCAARVLVHPREPSARALRRLHPTTERRPPTPALPEQTCDNGAAAHARALATHTPRRQDARWRDCPGSDRMKRRGPVCACVGCAPVTLSTLAVNLPANVAFRRCLPVTHPTSSSHGRPYCIGPRRRVSIMGVYAAHGVGGRIGTRTKFARFSVLRTCGAAGDWPRSMWSRPASRRRGSYDSMVQFFMS
jgi:hypothetical protein